MLKLALFHARDDRPKSQHDQEREQVRRRQVLTILFAILLISIAGVSSAQSVGPPVTLQYDGASCAPMVHAHAVDDAAQVTGGVIPTFGVIGDTRPDYVDLNAYLANFDSDAEPDGWRAAVMLLDSADRPVIMRAYAKFELIISVSTDYQLRFVNADVAPIRWSMPLRFDEDAVARVRLPLRERLHPLFGWDTKIQPVSRTSYRSSTQRDANRLNSRNFKHWNFKHWDFSNWDRPRNFVSRDLRTLLPLPSTGELRVRVSVPTEGVFKAAVPVVLRPSALVDTRWPYR